MAIVYFDSSALVKLVVDEDGSDVAAAVWDAADAAVSSRLAYPEVRAALAAAERSRRLRPAQMRQAEAGLADFWGAIRPVELSEPVADRAGELASQHGLRGADAVHLASLSAVGIDEVLFAVWDERLRLAAASLGARVVPA